MNTTENTSATAVYTQTGHCELFGSAKGARRVTGLSREEKEMIKAGQEVRLAGCPEYRGETDRRIVEISGSYYCRMP